jgi:NAD(P)-dependent dehydrogenase (short-subunit alcohol dehydrogenase family)
LPSGDDRLAGKTALVAGAAAGIGYATAERLAAEGAGLVLLDVADEISAVAARLRAAGVAAFGVQGDVSDEDAWQRAAGLARSKLGGVDILVSNAFANNHRPAHQLSRGDWDTMLAVNLTGTFLGVRACIDDLVERQGAVVITSSVHALIGLPGNPAYAAAKGGLTALTRQLAAEYGPAVRVNAVLPGPILTRVWDSTSEEDRQRTIEQTTAKRFGTRAGHAVPMVPAELITARAVRRIGAR